MPVRGAGGSRERIALTVVEIHRSPGRAAGLCAARVLRTLLRRGPVVSVGPGEILDRRLSTDWIPWTAARGIATVQIRRRRMIAFEVDPRIAASLPGEAHAARGAVEPGSSATTDTGSRPSTCAAASRPCPTRSRAAGPGLTGPRAAPHPGRGGAIAPMTRTGEPDRLAARGGPPSDCGIGGQARRQRPRQVRQTPSGSVIPRGIRSRRVLWRKPDTSRRRVVETTGIEPVTFPMSRECTTAVLRLLIDHDQVHRTWTPSR